jgi:hypothetical protein
MQASLKDLAHKPESPSFHICQRVLHECHEIIFGDLPVPSSTPYSTLRVPFYSRFSRKKVKPLLQPAVVGMGMVLAGIPGLPKLTDVMGHVAIEQGRVDDMGSEVKSLQSMVPATAPALSSSSQDQIEDDEDEENLEFEQNPTSAPKNVVDQSSVVKPGRRMTIGPSQTSPALSLHLARKAKLSSDPFGQCDSQQPAPVTAPFQSTPSIMSSRQHRASNLSEADVLLQKYDVQSQMHLLRSHFCQSEVRQCS